MIGTRHRKVGACVRVRARMCVSVFRSNATHTVDQDLKNLVIVPGIHLLGIQQQVWLCVCVCVCV